MSEINTYEEIKYVVDYINLDENKQVKYQMQCSNGIFTIAPVTYFQFLDKKKENDIIEFKAKHPEYANMKGIKHKEPSSVDYSGEATSGGETNGTLQTVRARRVIKELLCNEIFCQLLRYLKSNSYRNLKRITVLNKLSKINGKEKWLDILRIAGYLEVYLKAIRLNKEGKKVL